MSGPYCVTTGLTITPELKAKEPAHLVMLNQVLEIQRQHASGLVLASEAVEAIHRITTPT